MKIAIDAAGAHRARPDFGMLRAGFAAAQAATPTAIANARARAPIDPAAASTRLPGHAGAPDRASAAGAFHPGPVGERLRER